jgi:hypothetical protein
VTVWGIEPDWQRWQALRYLDNHFWTISGFAFSFGLCYLIAGWRHPGAILSLALCVLVSVTAVWLYLVIRWIDHRKGWAEQQAPKGISPAPTAPATEQASEGEPAAAVEPPRQ